MEGAIIRLGFGWGNDADTKAQRNINECKRLGIPFGIYWYSYAYDANCARAEGNDVAAKLRQMGVSPNNLKYPVYYDLEKWTWLVIPRRPIRMFIAVWPTPGMAHCSPPDTRISVCIRIRATCKAR